MDRNAQSSGDPKEKGRLKNSANVSEDEEAEERGRFLSSPPPSAKEKPRVISSSPASSSAPAARRGAVTGAGGVLCQADRCTADFTDAKRLAHST
jgi:hypothetical protein